MRAPLYAGEVRPYWRVVPADRAISPESVGHTEWAAGEVGDSQGSGVAQVGADVRDDHAVGAGIFGEGELFVRRITNISRSGSIQMDVPGESRVRRTRRVAEIAA